MALIGGVCPPILCDSSGDTVDEEFGLFDVGLRRDNRVGDENRQVLESKAFDVQSEGLELV